MRDLFPESWGETLLLILVVIFLVGLFSLGIYMLLSRWRSFASS
jgi:hypothetical protein